MRLTEALHYYNCETMPTTAWMDANYSQFYPTFEDEKRRKLYKKRLKALAEGGRRKRMKMRNTFR